MLGQTDAQEFYSSWIKATNRMRSEEMTPYLVDHLNYEHPTLRQQMVAMIASLLNGIDPNHGCDARCAASCSFVNRFQEWLEGYNLMQDTIDEAHGRIGEEARMNRVYIGPKGEIRFPFI